MDKDFRLLHLNNAALLITPINNDPTGTIIWDAFPKMKGSIYDQKYHEAMATGQPITFETAGIYTDAYFLVSLYPFEEGLTVYLKDITQHIKLQNELSESLEQKEVLMREIHHRVKNNLQLITSILYLQRDFIKYEEDKHLFYDTLNRIKAMAVLHQKLYEERHLERVNVNTYITDLINTLLSFYEDKRGKIKIVSDIEDLFIDGTSCITLGLLINELVTNSLKYAFPNDISGYIHVTVSKIDNRFILTFKDDGIGVPKDFNFSTTDSLGMQLINSLKEQMGGTLEVSSASGLKYIFSFPLNNY